MSVVTSHVDDALLLYTCLIWTLKIRIHTNVCVCVCVFMIIDFRNKDMVVQTDYPYNHTVRDIARPRTDVRCVYNVRIKRRTAQGGPKTVM